jgi:hypothetical protein
LSEIWNLIFVDFYPWNNLKKNNFFIFIKYLYI